MNPSKDSNAHARGRSTRGSGFTRWLCAAFAVASVGCGGDSGDSGRPSVFDAGNAPGKYTYDTPKPGTTPGATSDTASSPDAHTPDAAQPDGATPGGDVTVGPACSEVSDCPAAGLCASVSCVGGSCLTTSLRGSACCLTDADCDDGNPVTIGTCPTVGGPCALEANLEGCTLDQVLASATFEDGTAQGWTALDSDLDDGTAWALAVGTAGSGSFSYHLSFGAGADGTSGPARLRSPKLDLPELASAHAFFRVWLDMEPGMEMIGPLCSQSANRAPCYEPAQADKVGDQLRLIVIDPTTPDVETGGWTRTTIWSASALRKDTHDAFGDVAVDLSAWAGRGILLEFEGSYGHVAGAALREGAYLDDLEVATTCKRTKCTKLADCAAGLPPCADARCVGVASSPSEGLCRIQWPADCQACGNGAACDDGDVCTTDACTSGACQWTPSCCTPGPVVGPIGFEGATLPAGWTAQSNRSDVTWRASFESAASGAGHVQLVGDSGTYAGAAVDATLLSPPIALPAPAGDVLLTFSLRLDTEWLQGGDPKANPDASVDRFTVEVVTAAGNDNAVVFDSYDFGGATPDPEGGSGYWNATAKLSAYLGQVVRLRFRFASGDGNNNDYAGVFIDDLAIRVGCDLPAQLCSVDAQCAKTDACAPATCWAGRCLEENPDSHCCAAGSDCGDGNACEVWSCAASACSEDGLASVGCCDEAPRSLSQFEAPAADWTFDSSSAAVGWHWASAPGDAHAGGGALRMGLPGQATYDDPTVGLIVARAISPARWVLGAGESSAQFWMRLSTEYDGDGTPGEFTLDRLTVFAWPDGGSPQPVWNSAAVGGSTNGEWVAVSVSLAGFEAQRVALMFEFDSVDAIDNAHGGVWIDELQLVTDCPAATP